AEAGNHDNRNYEDDWAEKWQGLLERKTENSTNYDNQSNQLVAKNLKGKLLLVHGTTDSNVPPDNTLLVVNELVRANKDFDLLMLPNGGHGFGNEPYMIRRRWDTSFEICSASNRRRSTNCENKTGRINRQTEDKRDIYRGHYAERQSSVG